MKAMEEQIASLAGLVHSALSMGSDVPAVKALRSVTAHFISVVSSSSSESICSLIQP